MLIFTYSFRDFDPWPLEFWVGGRTSWWHKYVEDDTSGHEARKERRLPRHSKAPHSGLHPSGKAVPPKGPITSQTTTRWGIIQTITAGLWNLPHSGAAASYAPLDPGIGSPDINGHHSYGLGNTQLLAHAGAFTSRAIHPSP